MHWVWLIVMLWMIIIIINRGKKIKSLKQQLFEKSQCLQKIESRIQNDFIKKESIISISEKTSGTGVSYERALELNDRKIESKYIYPKADIEEPDNYFNGKKIVITGIFSEYPDRNELAEIFWNLGADIDRTIGKYTECLIVGDDAGPVKLQTAKAQKIQIIYEDELEDYFF